MQKFRHKFIRIIVALISIQMMLVMVVAASENGKYIYFTDIDGLPQNITTCLVKDQFGYLWIGTGNGIARYDGKNFYSYQELSSVGVIYLFNDSHNNIWAGTNKGLYKYNRLTNFFELKFKGYIPKIQEDNGKIYFLQTESIDQFNETGISNVFRGNNLSDFCFSKEGIWFSKVNEGVGLLSRESGFKKITATYLENIYVSHICKVEDKLFIGCHNGQLFVVMEGGRLKQIAIDNHYNFKKIVKIGPEFWLATDGNGIIILDKNLYFSRSLNRSQNTNASINSNSIYDIFFGNNGEIWLASYGAGLSCILPDNLLFQNILPEKGNENSLIANEGISVFVKEPYFVFGTNYGLSVWNENTRQFKNLPVDQMKRELGGIKVSSVNVDPKSNIWVGTYDGLLGKYNQDYKLLKTYHPSSNDPDEMQQIALLCQISNANMLIVTHFQHRVLLNFDTEKETTRVFELFSKGSNITYYLLNSLRENQQGELLALVSDKGLFHVNWKDNVLENKLPEMNKRIDCYISDFYHDKKGFYWFASSDSGLMRVSTNGRNYKKWTIKDGLPTNTLMRIESVDDHFLWISTNAGLCRFDTETGSVMNFNYRDGLPANEFSDRVSAKTNDGRIIFGSVAGFTIVDPTKVSSDTSKTDVVISDITFQNQSIRSPEGKQFLKQALEEIKEISLPFNKNSFSIYFFSKGKNFLQNNNYSYRLTGLEEQWIYLAKSNHTNYTNLSPGVYTFEVKCADKSQGNSPPTRLIIRIQSPWYLSWYAYIAYSVLFFTILYLSIYAWLKRLELKKEKEISEFKIQKEHELTEKKLAFFTNISHDLKTPLTLIDAPVNDLLQSKNLDHDQVNKLMIIRRNSKRLYKLIVDLLDFRKLTQKQYILEVNETDIFRIIEEIYLAFREECKNKSILLEKSVDEGIVGYVDAKKIEKILWNLLSNALKFSSTGGSIILAAEEITNDKKKSIKLTISDKGIGIAKKDQLRIFDRFHQIRDSKTHAQEGSGIGLSIVKELVEMHHGTISLTSILGVGTTFTLTIPIDKESYSEDELAVFLSSQVGNIDFKHEQVVLPNEETVKKPKHYNQPTLLIIEDNDELREYLASHFEKKYKVCQAVDGLDGLVKIKDVKPDLILTDVRMPNMNGYELCLEIRRNFDTSHLPVIMLTANNTVDQQIEGLSTGADAYISKPFDIKLLDTTLISVLENRKKLRMKFLEPEPFENSEKALPPKDVDFIQELKKYIEENLTNFDLNIDAISHNFAVSSSKLNRKIKSLFDTTPNNLIKSIRLRKAYQLLQDKNARVSEVAYLTGFSDPNYFTTCFKKEFGKNPSQIGVD